MPSTYRHLLMRLYGVTLRLTLPLLLVGGLILAIAWLGQLAAERVRLLDRYSIAFAAIDVPTPPGMERGAFLGEVQYLGGLPDQVSILDVDVAARVGQAFARHPWVEQVERVEIQPSRTLHISLVFRQPRLLVLPCNRVVDRHGILLPAEAPTDGLPVFTKLDARPLGTAGTPWGDAEVEAAARR